MLIIPLSLIIIHFTAPCLSTSKKNHQVILRTKFGFVRGLRKSIENTKYLRFTGIPYAMPPERLKKSQLVHTWPGIVNAQKLPPKCIPRDRPISGKYSEDCLYLNVLAPVKTNNSLPVLIYIHDGEFIKGDGNDPILDSFAETFVTNGIVVVTLQYRLASMGFLSLNCKSKTIPCNIGLWDQALAFKFINMTISSFGGDAGSMTLMGHGSSAMATSIHSISPITSKYFNNYIQLSGSSWGITRYASITEKSSLDIIDRLGCNSYNKTQLIDCFHNRTLDEIYSAQVNAQLYPQVGDDLLPFVPKFSTGLIKSKNVFMGLQSLESLYFTYLKSSPYIFQYIGRDTINYYINVSIALKYGIDSETAFLHTSHYYLPNSISDSDYAMFMKQRARIESNIVFDIPILREIKDKIDSLGTVYVYHFVYTSKNEFHDKFPVKESYNSNEFPFIWNAYRDKEFNFSDDDIQVSKFFKTALIQFILHGFFHSISHLGTK